MAARLEAGQERMAAAAGAQQAAALKALREELRRDNKRQEDAMERQARSERDICIQGFLSMMSQ